VAVEELSDESVIARTTEVARRRWRDAVVSDVRRLEGGVSSLTFAARISIGDGVKDVVLKLAPPGLEPLGNRDVLRQAWILDRLASLDGFPVPAVLLRDDGDPPGIPPMFAMQRHAGQAYEPLLDLSDTPPTATEVVAREHELTRALARLQSCTPDELGVSGEPAAPVAEELARWRRLLTTVDPDIAPGHEKLAERLAKRTPAEIAPRLVHGDYRAANMLFIGSRLEAIIDWEIWSVGDPRRDLAWILMHTHPAHAFHSDRSPGDREAGRLMPSADDLLATYVDARRSLGASTCQLTCDTADLPWFGGVAHYKVVATIGAIWKRERKRASPNPAVECAAARLDVVLAAGHAALDAWT